MAGEMEQEPLSVVGPFTAWATPNGMRAEVRDAAGTVVERFKGELAWSDARRGAEDRNTAEKFGRKS